MASFRKKNPRFFTPMCKHKIRLLFKLDRRKFKRRQNDFIRGFGSVTIRLPEDRGGERDDGWMEVEKSRPENGEIESLS